MSADPSLLCAGCRDLDDGHVLVPLEAEDDDELRVAGEGADGVRELDQLLGRESGANAVQERVGGVDVAAVVQNGIGPGDCRSEVLGQGAVGVAQLDDEVLD